MEIKELLTFREFLLDEAKDADGFISESAFLANSLPSLNETKLIDTDECNDAFTSIEGESLKINGYVINESGERLQIFIVNEDSLDLSKTLQEISISQKLFYEKQFARAVSFIRKSLKKQLDDVLQDSSPARPLISFLGSSAALEQIDVIEFFLISATATVETRGEVPQPKSLVFEDDSVKVTYSKQRERFEKEITLIKRLVDLNFLFNVVVSQGNREALEIDFTAAPLNYKISCIPAANEQNFETFLCVLPAALLAELYKRYSSRMLEKNVRSFLQLKGVNKGMQDTIRKYPEKFIAFNNGLTITATGKLLEEERGSLYIKSLKDFQIVNGGQTTATIYFSRKAGLDISKVRVMAKINVAKDATEEELDDLISSISTYSNAQTRVSKVDLRSRSMELIKLKSLSDSILTPGGRKWFFERAKGEFSTIVRKSPGQKARILREYPKERRFSKEDLAKYYTAWGDKPFLVKKGGEKVFRYFMEDIAGENKKKAIEIDRTFYENLIAKIILFRSLEKLHGDRATAIGQIRSAVVPYSISVFFTYTAGKKSDRSFDLLKIWKSEGLDENLSVFFKSLMTLINDLIKKYSESDDYGEYSKKEELWNAIIASKEVNEFMALKDSQKIIEQYTITKEALKKREAKKTEAVDFSRLADMVEIYLNGEQFYKEILSDFTLKESEEYKLQQIIVGISKHQDISPQHIDFEKNLMKRVRIENPDYFDELNPDQNMYLKKSFDFVLKKYNQAIESGLDIRSEFAAVKELATKKGAKFPSVFDEIGKHLHNGELPSIKHLAMASNFLH